MSNYDLDVLDPGERAEVKCPTPNGISVEVLFKLVSELKLNFVIVGASVLEFAGNKPEAVAKARSILEVLFTP